MGTMKFKSINGTGMSSFLACLMVMVITSQAFPHAVSQWHR
jgi:hypothetical protein